MRNTGTVLSSVHLFSFQLLHFNSHYHYISQYLEKTYENNGASVSFSALRVALNYQL